MIQEPDIDTGASFCGNCGTPVQAGAIACANCGHPIPGAATGAGLAQGPSGPAPADYIPYCRSCGVVVNWGDGHTCNRCGITPLCALHFRAREQLCFDCADAPAYSQTAVSAGAVRCGACGASIAPNADFCANCGRAVAASYGRSAYMGFWIRLAAFAIDRVIAYLIAAAIAAAIGLSRTSGEIDPNVQQDVTISLETINYSFLLLVWGIWTAYSFILTSIWGQTVGKRIVGIQVVDANGNVPPWHRVLLRELVGKFVSEAILWIGYIWISFDENKRGWHDFLGGSYVVRKRRGSNSPGGIV